MENHYLYLEEINKIKNKSSKKKAEEYLNQLLVEVNKLKEKGIDLQHFRVFYDDEHGNESIVFEMWLLMRRFGISIEDNEEDSGYYIIDVRDKNKKCIADFLDNLDLDYAIKEFIGENK